MGKKLLTADLDEFLMKEYEKKFKRIFKTLEEFSLAMQGEVVSCRFCGCLCWKATTKPCDCDYQQTLKKNNHVTQPQS